MKFLYCVVIVWNALLFLFFAKSHRFCALEQLRSSSLKQLRLVAQFIKVFPKAENILVLTHFFVGVRLHKHVCLVLNELNGVIWTILLFLHVFLAQLFVFYYGGYVERLLCYLFLRVFREVGVFVLRFHALACWLKLICLFIFHI